MVCRTAARGKRSFSKVAMGFPELCRLGLAGLLMLTLAQPSQAQTDRAGRSRPTPLSLTVVNASRRPVYQLRVSPTDIEQWGEDRLGKEIIPPGASFRVSLGRGANCRFDVQVTYDDVSSEERSAVDVCRVHVITFDGSTATPPPDPFSALRTVSFANQTGRTIQQVFISPESSDQWGDNLAPPTGIPSGTIGSVTYRGGCVADLRLVYDNRAAEERRGLDICAMPAMLIRAGWLTATKIEPPPASMPPGRITLRNRTGRTVTELYLAPEGAGTAGARDLLGDSVLPIDGQATVPFARGGACRFVARILYGGDRGEREQRGIDLCRSRTVVLDPVGGSG
jgi:hypothetical protein